MSITITNVSTHHDNVGVNTYDVRVNNYPVIARFDHVRSEGLAECLRRAAEAVELAERDRAEIEYLRGREVNANRD